MGNVLCQLEVVGGRPLYQRHPGVASILHAEGACGIVSLVVLIQVGPCLRPVVYHDLHSAFCLFHLGSRYSRPKYLPLRLNQLHLGGHWPLHHLRVGSLQILQHEL